MSPKDIGPEIPSPQDLTAFAKYAYDPSDNSFASMLTDGTKLPPDAVKRSGIVPVLAYYSPIPGTALWEEALAASRYDLSSDPLYSNNSVLPCRPGPFDWKWISELKKRIDA